MQTNFQNKKAVIWTQTNCQYCDMAKILLKSRGFTIEERIIGEGQAWSKKDLIAAVPDARSVPQIFLNDKYIGGYGQLKQIIYYDDHVKKS